MNYKGILTEEVAEQFRNEKATFAIISIFNEKDLIRDIEVQLTDPLQIFSVAGKNSRAEAELSRTFHGEVKDGKKWFPFHSIFTMYGRRPEKVLEEVAKVIKVGTTELEWSFIIEH